MPFLFLSIVSTDSTQCPHWSPERFCRLVNRELELHFLLGQYPSTSLPKHAWPDTYCIISIAESLLREISLVFQPKLQNEAIQTKENSSIMLASDTRNTETLTGYVPNPNDVNINHIVDQEIRIHLEVSELEEKYHNAAFDYYFKLYEWSRLKDQQIIWLYIHPEPAKILFNIDIDSNCSIEKSSKMVKKYFLI